MKFYLVSTHKLSTIQLLFVPKARSCECNKNSHFRCWWYSQFFSCCCFFFHIHHARYVIISLYNVLYTTILFSSFHTPLRHFFLTKKKRRRRNLKFALIDSVSSRARCICNIFWLWMEVCISDHIFHFHLDK